VGKCENQNNIDDFSLFYYPFGLFFIIVGNTLNSKREISLRNSKRPADLTGLSGFLEAIYYQKEPEL
jgi:hypothetical protein